MKAEAELRYALTDAMAIFEDGASKETMAEKVGNLCAVLNIFTDHAFTKEEQYHLFQNSAKRLKELEEKLK